MNKILVTGSTGSLGTSIINYLQKKTDNVSVAGLARDEQKATGLKEKGVEIRIGNYDDPESLQSAFEGINTLVFISSSDLENRSTQHKNVIDVAAESGIDHIIYTSFQRETENEQSPIWMVAESHLKTEEWIKASEMDYTFLQNNLYMDFIPMFLGDQVMEQGTVYLPAADGLMACALRDDMAEATANIALDNQHRGKTYRFANSQNWSFHEVAEILSSISGKDISYVSPEVSEYMSTMKKFDVPEDAIGMSVGFARAIAEGELAQTSSDFERILGRKPVSLPDFLSRIYS